MPAADLDLLSDFLEEPGRAARAAGAGRPFGLGCLGYLAAGLSFFLAQALLRRFLFLSSGPISLILLCLTQLVGGLVLAGILHLLAETASGRPAGERARFFGAAGGLFVLLGLSELAWTLLVPGALVLRLLGLDSWACFLALAALAGWASLALKARSLRDLYGLSRVRAWAVLLAPYLASVFLGAAAFLLVMVGLALAVLRLAS